jgi:hypothetical protein
MAADQIIVVKKSLKDDGAKSLACSGFILIHNQQWDD